MKDARGYELAIGQTVLFSLRTGGFGAHRITEGTVVNVAKKMVRIEYQYKVGQSLDFIEGNYYPNAVTVVELPVIPQSTQP